MRPRLPVIFLLLVLPLVLLLSAQAEAQWGRRGRSRGGVVMTPYGPLYDTRSPEWRAAGGNIFIYQQLREQTMMLQQERMMMKQRELLAKQAKQNQGKGAKGRTNKASEPSLNADWGGQREESLQQVPVRRRKSRTAKAGVGNSGPAKGRSATASKAPASFARDAAETPPTAAAPASGRPRKPGQDFARPNQ